MVCIYCPHLPDNRSLIGDNIGVVSLGRFLTRLHGKRGRGVAARFEDSKEKLFGRGADSRARFRSTRR
jgi:hypothetical protein